MRAERTGASACVRCVVAVCGTSRDAGAHQNHPSAKVAVWLVLVCSGSGSGGQMLIRGSAVRTRAARSGPPTMAPIATSPTENIRRTPVEPSPILGEFGTETSGYRR